MSRSTAILIVACLSLAVAPPPTHAVSLWVSNTNDSGPGSLRAAIRNVGFYGQIEFAPTLVSKANTATQIVMLIMLMIGLCGFGQLSQVALFLVDPWCFYLLAVLGLSSGIDYVWTWGLKAWRNWQQESPGE